MHKKRVLQIIFILIALVSIYSLFQVWPWMQINQKIKTEFDKNPFIENHLQEYTHFANRYEIQRGQLDQFMPVIDFLNKVNRLSLGNLKNLNIFIEIANAFKEAKSELDNLASLSSLSVQIQNYRHSQNEANIVELIKHCQIHKTTLQRAEYRLILLSERLLELKKTKDVSINSIEKITNTLLSKKKKINSIQKLKYLASSLDKFADDITTFQTRISLDTNFIENVQNLKIYIEDGDAFFASTPPLNYFLRILMKNPFLGFAILLIPNIILYFYSNSESKIINRTATHHDANSPICKFIKKMPNGCHYDIFMKPREKLIISSAVQDRNSNKLKLLNHITLKENKGEIYLNQIRNQPHILVNDKNLNRDSMKLENFDTIQIGEAKYIYLKTI